MVLQRRYLYQQVAEAIKSYIARHHLQHGDPLPSERELCEELGVSRTSLREGLRALSMMGVVEVRSGEGMFVGRLEFRNLFSGLSVAMLGDVDDVRDLLEIRATLEVLAVGRAARRIAERELQELAETLDEMERRIRGNQSFLEEDIRFHEIILQVADSRLLGQFLGAISGWVRDIREAGLRVKGVTSQALDQHRDIWAALRDREPERAEAAMRVHMQTVRADVLGDQD